MAKEIEIFHRGLPKPRSWITAMAITFVAYFVGYLTRTLSPGMWWTINGWWLPPIYIISFNEIIRRIKPKYALNPAQLVIALIPMFMVGGKTWLAAGTGECNGPDVWALWSWGYSTVALVLPDIRDYYLQADLPPWVVPKDVVAAEIRWRGLAPGEMINWGIWGGIAAFWSLIVALTFLAQLFFVYTFLAPQWVETEKVTFPMAIPTIFMVQQSAMLDEEGKRSRLFNFKANRVFWYCVIVGFLFSIPFYINQIFITFWPVVGLGVGFLIVDPTSITAPILPGAYTWARFYMALALWATLCPYDVLITIVLGWFIFQFIYPVIVVRTGLTPYQPGSEANFWYYGLRDPFPFAVWGRGILLGLSIYFIWTFRRRILSGIKALVGTDTRTEHGISMRWGTLGFIVSSVLLLALWVSAGMDIIPGIILLGAALLWYVGHARIYAEIAPWGSECSSWVWMWAYASGPLTGSWSWNPPQPPTRSSLVWGMASELYSNCLSPVQMPEGVGGFAYTYKLGYEARANLNDQLKFMTVMIIIMIPIMIFFNVYLSHHMGLSNLDESARTMWEADWYNALRNVNIRGSAEAAFPFGNIGKWWAWTIVGAISGVILQFIRGILPGFFINPIILAAAITNGDRLWLNALFALVLKYILSKALGPKRAAMYLTEIASGLTVGTGLFYIVGGIYALQQGIARAMILWR